MVIGNKSESFGKLAVPAESARAARLRCEAAMSDCVNSVLSRYANSLEKKREVPLQSGSIWDLDPNCQKRVKKNGSDVRLRLNIGRARHSLSKYPADNHVHVNDISYCKHAQNMQAQSYVDELFPDLPPVRVSAAPVEDTWNCEMLLILGETSYDSIPPSFKQVKEAKPRRRPRHVNYAKYKPSFEDWSRQRFQEPVPPSVKENSVEKPPKPYERDKLHHIENNYFYDVIEDDSNFEDDSSESEIAEDESLNFTEIEEQPTQAKRSSSVLDYLKKSGLLLSVPSAFYGTNKNPSGTRILSNKRFNVGSFKQILVRTRHFYVKPDGFLTIKLFKDGKEEELVLLGLHILEIRKIFPQVFRLIAATHLQGIAVPYSCSAIKVVFMYAFRLSFQIADWQVAMEVYKLACVLDLPGLKEDVITYFSHKPISIVNVMEASALADDLSFREMLENVLVSGEGQPLPEKGEFSFENKCCTLSYSLYKEPEKLKSLIIPQYCKFSGDLAMIKKTDIQNELEIEAVKTLKTIAGVELKFVLDRNDVENKVGICCDVTQGKKQVWGMEKKMTLKPLMSFMFDKKISVGAENIRIHITVEDIQYSFCFYVEKQVFKDEFLKVSIKSNNTNSEKKYLCFISKVLYS